MIPETDARAGQYHARMSDQVSGEQQSPSVGGSGSGAVATAPKSRTGLYVIVGVAVFAIVAIWIYSVQQDRRDALERAQDSGVATGSASPTDAASVESMSDEDREALYLSMVTSDVEGASRPIPMTLWLWVGRIARRWRLGFTP